MSDVVSLAAKFHTGDITPNHVWPEPGVGIVKQYNATRPYETGELVKIIKNVIRVVARVNDREIHDRFVEVLAKIQIHGVRIDLNHPIRKTVTTINHANVDFRQGVSGQISSLLIS